MFRFSKTMIANLIDQLSAFLMREVSALISYALVNSRHDFAPLLSLRTALCSRA